MATISISRGELTAIPFTITDPANGLAGVRVTWSVALQPSAARILRKVGGLPGSSADITITSQTAGSIAGTINIAVTDFATLYAQNFVSTLWTDNGSGSDRCVTAGGVDTLVITDDVPRIA